MTAINQQRTRIATWLKRERLRNELYGLSDRNLIRYQAALEACKLLWMA